MNVGASQPDRDAGSAAGVHANALVIGETGVLVRGPSGSGKSSLTLALLAVAADRGQFAALVGDDRVLVRPVGGRILAAGAPSMRGLAERRGYGLVAAAAEPCALLRLVVDLMSSGTSGPRQPEDDELIAILGGVALPRLAFDERTGPFERAYAILEHLDRIDSRNVSEKAHFA